jgi:hypothetical protein
MSQGEVYQLLKVGVEEREASNNWKIALICHIRNAPHFKKEHNEPFEHSDFLEKEKDLDPEEKEKFNELTSRLAEQAAKVIL